MAEMPNIDPNFEPQSRPRSGTWPLNRPNIPSIRNRLHGMGGGTLLDATLEEANSQELIADSNMMLEFPKDDYLPMLSPDSMLNPSGFGVDSVLIGLPTGPTANLVEDYPLSGTLVKPEPSNNNNILGDYCATTTTITELSNLNDSQSFDDIRGMPESMQCQTASSSANFSPVGNTTPPASTTVSSSQSSTSATSGATPKAKSTRKNAWGNMSYADLITQAIESSPEKRLTLAQIYEWMVKNVAYFKDKGDSNSSAGWKNSIRHNLSLHAKFKRIQNEGTGKSSWWVINHDAKPGKPARRRVQSMDNANQKYNRSKNKALAKQKAELIKKQKAGLKAGESWPGTSGLETTVSKALGSEYRQRASSNASSIAGRLSPLPLFPSQDLEEDTGPNMSPMGSAANLANLSSSSLPSAFDIFSVVRSDNTSSAIPENNEMLHDNLLDSLANIAVVSSPGPYGDQQVDSKSGIYLQQLNDGQQQNRNRKNLVNNPAQNSPNLASLLQRNPKSPPKNSSTPITKREPEWNESKTPYVYSDYQSPQIMGQVMQSPPQQYKPQMNDGKPMYRYVMPRQNVPENSRYAQPGQMRPPAQVNYIQQQQQQQQQTEMQRYLANQQRQQQQMVQQMENPPPQYPGQQSNLVSMNVKFPSDLNLDNQELYDSGDLDMSEALEGIQPSNDSYNFNMMDFDGKPANFFQQQLLQESNEYNMAMNGNNGLVQHQQAPPVMHPNPDIFITNQGPGTASMDSMMDGCRMNTATNFQRTQQGQTPSVGAASGYTMQ